MRRSLIFTFVQGIYVKKSIFCLLFFYSPIIHASAPAAPAQNHAQAQPLLASITINPIEDSIILEFLSGAYKEHTIVESNLVHSIFKAKRLSPVTILYQHKVMAKLPDNHEKLCAEYDRLMGLTAATLWERYRKNTSLLVAIEMNENNIRIFTLNKRKKK